MTWTATLVDAEDRETHWFVEIDFTDGVRTKRKGFPFTGALPKDLAAFVRQKALEFERTDTATDFTTLIGQSIDVTPPVVVPPADPTAEDIAKAAWFTDYRQLQSLLTVTEAVPALATTQSINLIASLRASLETDWLNAYLGDI